jgi:predicted HTH transcriptional regulator
MVKAYSLLVDLVSLRNRLRLGEDSRTEFKRADDNALKSIEKSLVAFANSGGGEVFIGVENDGTPAGVGSATDADRWMRQISQLCQTRIEPALSCRIDKAEIDGHLVLIVEIPTWAPNRPTAAVTSTICAPAPSPGKHPAMSSCGCSNPRLSISMKSRFGELV